MNDLTITCPNCHSEIELSEAVSHRLREQMTSEFTAKMEAQQKAFAERERQLRNQQSQLEQAKESIDLEVTKRLASEKLKLLSAAREQAQVQLSAEMQDLRTQLAEREKKLSEAQQAELALRKQQRDLEAQKQALELEVARKLDAERQNIAEQAKAQAIEEQRLRVAEKEKLIGDLQKQIATLQQKAEQGSMQLQGEVLELALEDQLHTEFIYDLIEPVAKGQRGADVLQRVRTNTGADCGAILWETKRTKNWGKDWAAKLKEDQRAARAELAVLVSQTLPPGCRSFGQLDGIWVCDFACVLPLAAALRQGLVGMAAVRQAGTGKQTKMEQLYQYLAGTEFRHRVEALVESFVSMKSELDEERRAFAKHQN